MKGIYRFKQNCGRMGILSGIFVAEKAAIEKAMGQTIYISDMLGKHSEVEVTLGNDCVQFLSDRQTTVLDFEDFKLETGINPLDYIDWSDEDEETEGEDK